MTWCHLCALHRLDTKAAQMSAAKYVFVLRQLLRKAQVQIESEPCPSHKPERRRHPPPAPIDSQVEVRASLPTALVLLSLALWLR